MSDNQITGHYYTDAKSGLLTLAQYQLRVIAGPDKGRELSLGGSQLVGTHTGNDLVLSDSTVSRYHLEIQSRRRGLWVKDQNTTNGTYFQGAKIGAIEILKRTELKLGKHTTLEFLPSVTPIALAPYPTEKFGEALGRCESMKALFALLRRVAQSDATLLLTGETGTGKEILAEAVHLASQRKQRPFVVVDCGAIPSELIASELFGHARGSFSGATSDKKGLIESAQGGTLFLDEIGELSLHLQPQLLRVLESREIRRVGESHVRPVDCRVVAATHRELSGMVKRQLFREDLYYRLAVVEAKVPALRERVLDIPLLAQHFAIQLGRPSYAFSESMSKRLAAHPWPGNVRELRNMVQRTLSLGSVATQTLSSDASQSSPPKPPFHRPGSEGLSDLPFKEAKSKLVEAFERDYIEQLLLKHDGNISQAANDAGIDRNYIHRLVKKHQIVVRRQPTDGD